MKNLPTFEQFLNEAKASSEFKPHMMYDPKTGKEYKAETHEDHVRMAKLGYVHEKPEVNEKKYDYPSFQSNKGIHYQDMLISKGYWSYMGKERFGKGLYMNIDNRQTYGFGPDDIEYFKKHLKDIEVMESVVDEAYGTGKVKKFNTKKEVKDFLSKFASKGVFVKEKGNKIHFVDGVGGKKMGMWDESTGILSYDKKFTESVNEARNTIGLAFKDEDEYKDFKEFAEDNGAKIYKDKGFDSKTKSWYIEMEESQLAHIYGDIQPGNKNSGWMAIKDDFESVIVS